MGICVKALSFEIDGRSTFGVATDDGIREASEAYRSQFADLRAVLAAGALPDLEGEQFPEPIDASKVRFLPTIPNPDKLICVGVNYRPHAEEMGRGIPKYPVLFVRFPASQTGHGQPLIKPRVSEQFDFEGELALVIGERARHVSRAGALDVIAGYCCFMDGTVRDWQRHASQITPGKNFHHSGALGPYLVSRNEVGDPSRLQLITRVNGDVMQQARLSELIFDIPALIEYCSAFTELLPGDVIATGTPGGVGAARQPPQWLNSGDSVEVDIGPVGCLRNPVRDERNL